MAGTQESPLDEIQWRSPAIAQSMNGIHTNSVLPYFSHSPFFDATSNNASLTTQATFNPSMFHLIQTREAFEGRLRTMQGLEFMVAYEPAETAAKLSDGVSEGPSNMWIIRKQTRRKGHGVADDVKVLSSYFVIGENIYMAPSVGNVIASRMLSTVTLLTKFLSTASTLPNFSPSLGHTYIKPSPKPPTSVASSQQAQQSKESTPMPDVLGRGSRSLVTSLSSSSSESFQETRSLAEALNMTLRHGTEYMDENPLVGEPGAFMLSSTHGHAQAQSQIGKGSSTQTKPPTVVTTQGLGNAAATGKGDKKGAKSGDKSPTSASAPNKPKRRKSKAAGAIGSLEAIDKA
ncbi:MAG: Mediator of RNA polymerase II transcription subunit 6 [Piccolia ochrophora]|nr:MAG: Mediator of RNA polymerase II transcription subunit 6 [Piccolia ochrophora]